MEEHDKKNAKRKRKSMEEAKTKKKRNIVTEEKTGKEREKTKKKRKIVEENSENTSKKIKIVTEEKTGKEREKMEALWEEEEEPKDSEINSLVAEPTVEVFLPENPLDIVIKEEEEDMDIISGEEEEKRKAVPNVVISGDDGTIPKQEEVEDVMAVVKQELEDDELCPSQAPKIISRSAFFPFVTF